MVKRSPERSLLQPEVVNAERSLRKCTFLIEKVRVLYRSSALTVVCRSNTPAPPLESQEGGKASE